MFNDHLPNLLFGAALVGIVAVAAIGYLVELRRGRTARQPKLDPLEEEGRAWGIYVLGEDYERGSDRGL